MKIKAKKDYLPAPEYQGVAVCVDVTEPEERETQWGTREEIRIIFEIPPTMEDGRRFTVRSAPMTTSLHEKASLRKFIRQMRGRDLKGDELKEFDIDSLIGMCVNISIVHEESDDGRVFDRIALCRPWEGEAMEPSGDYVHKTKKAKDEKSGTESAYRRSEGAATKSTDRGVIKVHIGKHRGHELRDLSREAIESLIDHWLNVDFTKITKPSADDKRLASALEDYKKEFSKAPPKPQQEEEEEDDVPY